MGPGEGSGLLDIRSMANAYLGTPRGAAPTVGTIDDLPVFGGATFSEPAVIVPMAARSERPRFMYAMFGAVGALAIAVVVLVVVLLGNRGDASAATPEVVAPKPAPVVDAPKAQRPSPQVAQVEPAPAPPVVEAPRPAPAPQPHVTPPPPVHTHITPPPAHVTPPPVHAATGDACADVQEVQCVMNDYAGACCVKYKPVTTKPAERSELPDTLTSAMIQTGVSAIQGKAMACGGRSSAKGKVKVHVRVSAAGAVAGVSVETTPDAAISDCVAAVMQRATFAKTQKGGSFAYPFTF